MDRVLGSFLKNNAEVVVATISEFQGEPLAHLRIAVPSAVDEGEFIHTQKGIALKFEDIPALGRAVNSLVEVAGPDRVVGRIPIGKDEIRIGTQRFKGNQYVYVRRFFADGEGTWQPTRKGVTVATHQLDDLIALVNKLVEEASGAGRSV